MSSNVYAVEPNPLLDHIAKLLGKAKQYGDKVPLPDLMGGGLGSFMLGQAPEEVNNWAQGNSPFYDSSYGEGINRYARIKPGREDGVISAATLPSAVMGAVSSTGKLASAGIGSLVRAGAGDAATDLGRRGFLKGAGAAAAAATAAPWLLKGAGKDVVEHAPAGSHAINTLADHLNAHEAVPDVARALTDRSIPFENITTLEDNSAWHNLFHKYRADLENHVNANSAPHIKKLADHYNDLWGQGFEATAMQDEEAANEIAAEAEMIKKEHNLPDYGSPDMFWKMPHDDRLDLIQRHFGDEAAQTYHDYVNKPSNNWRTVEHQNAFLNDPHEEFRSGGMVENTTYSRKHI